MFLYFMEKNKIKVFSLPNLSTLLTVLYLAATVSVRSYYMLMPATLTFELNRSVLANSG